LGHLRHAFPNPEATAEFFLLQAGFRIVTWWLVNNDSGTESLWRDRSFWGLTVTQFLGAFNDNLYKQMLLLLFVAVPVAGEVGKDGGPVTIDRQPWALLCFSLPFILFSGYAGYLSDRFSKRSVIVLSKVAEIGVMLLGLLGFILVSRFGTTTPVFVLLCVVIGLMGTQSAFFGPGKYGSLPELLPARHLPIANGMVLMSTFVAIILGAALAGILFGRFEQHLWLPGLVCVVIAVAGTASSLAIRSMPPSSPHLKFNYEMLGVPRDIRLLLRQDRPLRQALMVSTIFWLTAALVQPAVNALGERQLNVGKELTSWLVAIISLGIAGGSLLAGFLGRGERRGLVQKGGAIGMFVALGLMCLPGGAQGQLLGYAGSMAVLVALGGFTGMFAVPLQVFLQSRPPDGLKGRMIATQNLLNWIGIFVSNGIYEAARRMFEIFQWPDSAMFAVCAVLVIPLMLAYRSADKPDLATDALPG